MKLEAVSAAKNLVVAIFDDLQSLALSSGGGQHRLEAVFQVK